MEDKLISNTRNWYNDAKYFSFLEDIFKLWINPGSWATQNFPQYFLPKPRLLITEDKNSNKFQLSYQEEFNLPAIPTIELWAWTIVTTHDIVIVELQNGREKGGFTDKRNSTPSPRIVQANYRSVGNARNGIIKYRNRLTPSRNRVFKFHADLRVTAVCVLQPAVAIR